MALVAAGTLAGAAPSPALGSAERTRPYVVVYDTPPRATFPVQRETVARERAHGFSSDRRFRHALDGFAAWLTSDQARALRADPEVALVAPDRTLHAARVPLAARETVPTGVARIGAAGVAGVHPPSSSAVAVLDTGIDLSHPELVARAGPNCTAEGPPQDYDGHGTIVAGVVGARNDGTGLVGVAPGTELYAVKVLAGAGAGLVSQIICGIDWVTANAAALGIRVANMSLSGPVQAEPLHLAIQRSVAAGIVYVAAAGNSASDLSGEIPGSYQEVLAVTAISDSDGAPGGAGPDPPCWPGQRDDSLATFSNYAARPADVARVVAAPGVCITSAARGGGRATDTGTSFAAPHAAGVVALCMGEAGRAGPCAEMTPAEVIAQVRADAAANATPDNGFAGDPFSSVGPNFGHLVSAADPTVRRIPPRPAPPTAAATSPPPALDTALELLAMRIRRRQDVDRLRVVARLGEPGTVTAAARVRVPGFVARARIIRAPGATARAVPHRTQRLRLRLRAAGLRRIKRALRRGVRMRARVTMTVSDLAGNTRTKARRVRLRR